MSRTNELIKSLREKVGLSASQFAKVMDVDKSTVSRWEKDDIPGIEMLYKIARYFRVSVDELLRGALSEDGGEDKLTIDYNLSSFDVPYLIEKKDKDGLVKYFKKCQKIKTRFLKLLPNAAYYGLNDATLEEFKYLRRYICIDSEKIIFKRDCEAYSLGKLDPNEMSAIKDFYENIKNLSKVEKDWEIDKIVYFKDNLYTTKIISLGLFEPFIEMFKCLSQFEKDEVLYYFISKLSPIDSIRNKYILSMINEGAKVMVSNVHHSHNWDDIIVEAYDGKLDYVELEKKASCQDPDYYFDIDSCSYIEYLELVDEKKTETLKEASQLRKTSPNEYYQKLRAGEYDQLLDF